MTEDRGIALEPLSPRHAASILAHQDDALVREVFGTRWEPASLAAFLQRTERWSPEGPLRELAAVDETGALIGGGGVHRLGAGLERHQAALTYWVLPKHRGQGWGRRIAAQLLPIAAAHPATSELILRIAPDNSASMRIARSLGAAPTGILERHPADVARMVERWTVPEDRF